jgi:hypothetical protein
MNFWFTNYNRGQDLLEGRNANSENHRNGQSFLDTDLRFGSRRFAADLHPIAAHGN